MHSQHVRPVYELTVSNAGDPEDEADEVSDRVEGAGGHPADALAHRQKGGWHDVNEVMAPDLALQIDTCGAVRSGLERSDDEGRLVGHLEPSFGGALEYIDESID